VWDWCKLLFVRKKSAVCSVTVTDRRRGWCDLCSCERRTLAGGHYELNFSDFVLLFCLLFSMGVKLGRSH
jgi:hypothetical protein